MRCTSFGLRLRMGKAANVVLGRETLFLLLTALMRNFYKSLMDRLDTKATQLKKTSRIKALFLRFISVLAKWIRTARCHELNFCTENLSYKEPFSFADG